LARRIAECGGDLAQQPSVLLANLHLDADEALTLATLAPLGDRRWIAAGHGALFFPETVPERWRCGNGVQGRPVKPNRSRETFSGETSQTGTAEPVEAITGRKLGVVRQAQGIPLARLRDVMRDLFRLDISEGALVNILAASAKPFASAVAAIEARRRHFLAVAR
ncbi:MAG: hypothetical protein HC888_03750, partial [Candidatus Competibacteraceae bacterium]|nr:hypothetical protein [Candidatus Competibacteraceae bacterium]